MAEPVSRSPELRAPPPPPDPANDPSNFYRQFLRRSALVTVLLALLPIFPSIAPQFVNQTLHARSWELLQLVFVGIAVSYGLFSRKNDQTEKEHGGGGGGGPKPESAHSYVSKLLQFSSVFDDEPESPQAVIHEESKVQTLNSQYFRGEPVVMVAEQIQSNPVVRKENGFCEITHNKPLLLPIRSLKQRVPESGEVDSGEQPLQKSDPNSISKLTGDSGKSRNVEVSGSSPPKVDDDLVVLRSPIPWRSRSGRMMKMDENEDMKSNSIDDSTFNPNLTSRKMPTQSTSFPSKSQPKSFASSPPPTPPPPPPPQFVWKSMLLKSSSSFTANNSAPLEKVLRRSSKSVPAAELGKSKTEQLPRRMENNNVAKFVGHTTEFSEKNGYSGKGLLNRNSVEKDVMETSDDDDSENRDDDDDYFGGISGLGGDVTNSSSIVNNNDISNNGDLGPDVDKKADEFIAKFREQIRLQRIESIRKSAAQRGAKTCGAR